ncbi:MAG: hypothetical protein E3K36_04345 [Candidatus Brocadia sp.]|nr:hypothetical protein [Candidatus Brocadia sp.]
MITKSVLERNTKKTPATITCKRCGVIHETSKLHIKVIPLKDGASHYKTICSACKAPIKFLRHEEPTFWFGKYKGRLVRDILQSDPRYVRWVLSQSIGSKSFRNSVRALLSGGQLASQKRI